MIERSDFQNVMSFDVEEWFHLRRTEDCFPLEQWGELPARLPHCLGLILDLLAETGNRATFFWLGWCAERHPEWVRRVAGLETRLPVDVSGGPEVTVEADGDQLEQLLINLVRNAADAALETGGGVSLAWKRNRRYVEVYVDDEGPGLSNTANLFVPFFTTKPGGSGIGLVLCRQIAEAHEGSLTLENRKKGGGCQAKLRLPL